MPAHGAYFLGYEVTKNLLESEKGADDKSPLTHFTAGLVAEVLGALLWTPMDVVKQRLQVQDAVKNNTSLQKHVGTTEYRGSMHAMRTIIRQEGFAGLYRGFLPGIATYCPFVGIYFVAYEQLKLCACAFDGALTTRDLPFAYHLASGAMAGAIASAITCPLDVVKTRIQVQSSTATNRYLGMADAIKDMLKVEGPTTFWKGLGARILWIAPGCAITMACYEQFKNLLDMRW
mmetsp:Transcript_46977/g.118358  ORF Transcript_46977/g.118358 Transcript_46977/m.118358 type:complete len:232 (+) Transcript_46977:199-894(+)